MTERKFYKKLKVTANNHSQIIYLFKYLNNLSSRTAWISAYKDKKGTQFIVESGAGIPEDRMESQVRIYCERELKNKGFI